MSTFQNAIPEPKKVFLDLLMKNADFLGQQIAMGKYTDAVAQMLRISTDIYEMAPKDKIDPLYNKLEKWLFVNGGFTSRDVQIANKEIKCILQNNFFSELQIGIIPTSTLQTEKECPSPKALIPSSNSI